MAENHAIEEMQEWKKNYILRSATDNLLHPRDFLPYKIEGVDPTKELKYHSFNRPPIDPVTRSLNMYFCMLAAFTFAGTEAGEVRKVLDKPMYRSPYTGQILITNSSKK